MKILIDMNLSPDWIPLFEKNGWQAMHWSQVGAPGALDSEIMQWALLNDCIVFTHDLDFGKLLALTAALGPSVIQIRSAKVLPRMMGDIVIQSLSQFKEDLQQGALLVVEPHKSRARLLPLKRK